MVVLTDTTDDARQLEHQLQAEYDAAPAGAKPFVALHALWDAVPAGQARKIPVLEEIGERLTRARDRHFLNDREWAKVKDYVPPEHLAPFGIDDVPESIARPFTEKDGTRGRLVLVEAEPGKSSDLHYLLRYSASFRETHLPSGKVVRGSGRAVIFADILASVIHDIPRAISLSLSMTLLTVIVTFGRRVRRTLSVLFALAVGVSGEAIFLYGWNVHINFLNFAALPITFGIGVDYAVNVVQRYEADGGADILAALRTTGGAVVLCSLTTMLGHSALASASENRAIRSLGLIAVVGEVSCLLAAISVLPALWLLIERRRMRRVQARAQDPAAGSVP